MHFIKSAKLNVRTD